MKYCPLIKGRCKSDCTFIYRCNEPECAELHCRLEGIAFFLLHILADIDKLTERLTEGTELPESFRQFVEELKEKMDG